jgi:hypothetical protein
MPCAFLELKQGMRHAGYHELVVTLLSQWHMQSFLATSALVDAFGCKQIRLACAWIICTATSVTRYTSPSLFEANIRSELDLEANHSWVHLADERDRHD